MSRKRFETISKCFLLLAVGCLISCKNATSYSSGTSIAIVPQDGLQTAIFAGGCFWCMEPPFEKLDGVTAVESGYTGGQKIDPTYQEVCDGKTGHVEAIQVSFDPTKIAYQDLLEVFWRNIDPTDSGGQFVDRGATYASAIFVSNDQQRKIAEASKQRLQDSGRFNLPVVTPIRNSSTFYVAEEYHQDYYKTHSKAYKRYRNGSGRDQFIERTWGEDRLYKPSKPEITSAYFKPSDEVLKKKLSRLEFDVTQRSATERPFSNEYWDNKADGIYVDIVSGEPLFSSKDKFKSGTGWPSFTQPLSTENIVEKSDGKLGLPRVEVRSKHADSHLGHVFNDGPAETGLRYCVNSAALRFVDAKDLEKEGYQKFAKQFTQQNN